MLDWNIEILCNDTPRAGGICRCAKDLEGVLHKIVNVCIITGEVGYVAKLFDSVLSWTIFQSCKAFAASVSKAATNAFVVR